MNAMVSTFAPHHEHVLYANARESIMKMQTRVIVITKSTHSLKDRNMLCTDCGDTKSPPERARQDVVSRSA